jgi:hypothetical protein
LAAPLPLPEGENDIPIGDTLYEATPSQTTVNELPAGIPPNFSARGQGQYLDAARPDPRAREVRSCGRESSGVVLGRQVGQRRPSHKKAKTVLAMHRDGLSYRLIGRNVGLSKNTVMEIQALLGLIRYFPPVARLP